MPETKTKRAPRKSAKAGHSPMPMGPGSTCGHSGCDTSCKVRYSGPTSHTRDHLIHEAAHGVRHIWMASIVAGLAVVLTGSIAYTAVDAASAPKVKTLNDAVSVLWIKLDNVERMVKQINEKIPSRQQTPGGATSTNGTMPVGQNGQGGQQGNNTKPSAEVIACVEACRTTWTSCQQGAADNTAKEACTKTAYACAKACVPSGAPVPPLTKPPTNAGGQQGGQGAPQEGGDQANSAVTQ